MFTSTIDESFLRGALERGEVVLVLGAGASSSSQNRDGEPVKLASKLAETIAGLASMPYANETLTEVLGAVEGSLVKRSQSHLMWHRCLSFMIPDSLKTEPEQPLQSQVC